MMITVPSASKPTPLSWKVIITFGKKLALSLIAELIAMVAGFEEPE
jgi:hypothetical protein